MIIWGFVQNVGNTQSLKKHPKMIILKIYSKIDRRKKMTVVERIKIEIREMEGYDISDIDYENYVHDRIDQQYERIKKLIMERNKNGIK